MIKVHVAIDNEDENTPAGESFWADDKGQKENQAEVCNIPVFVPDISLGDIIEYKEDGDGILEVVRVVKKVTNKFFVRYDVGKCDEDAVKNYREMVTYLNEHKIRVEGFMKGFMACAHDKKMSKRKLNSVMNGCPHTLPMDE